MSHPASTTQHPAAIAQLDSTFREKDGVVFDADSYAKHFTPPPANPPSATPTPTAQAPQGVFLTPPVHIGWYETKTEIQYPQMGGCVAYPIGSGSGSWLSSYLTSYLSSFSSWYTSGSFALSGTSALGGYGLDLI